MNKVPAVISGSLSLALLVLTIVTCTRPIETTAKVVQASYEHRGEFTYAAYTAETPDTSSPLVLYTKIIDNLDMMFACSGPNTGSVSLSVSLEDQSTGWRKEIPVTTSGGPVYTFPLDLQYLLDLGNAINTEIGGRSNSYFLQITAVAGANPDALTATVEGTLNSSTLVWEEDGFRKVEKGFPGDDNLVRSAFGYRAKLIDNALFGPIVIERLPDIPEMKVIDSANTAPTSQVEYVKLGFAYRLLSNAKVQSVSNSLQMELTLSETDGWSKTYPLQTTEPSEIVNQDIYLDIGKLLALADANDEAAGGRASQDRQVTVNVRVHTIARTDQGVIDEVFQQQLSGKIGKLLTWSTQGEGGTNSLISTKTGQLTKTVTHINDTLRILRLVSIIALVIGIGAFAFFLIYYSRRNPRDVITRELKNNRKKYKELISEVDSFPQNGTQEKFIHVPSMDSLAKISNNSLKPILLKIEPDGHFYRVVDGQFTYQYEVIRERLNQDK
jgi:hypothetical protein